MFSPTSPDVPTAVRSSSLSAVQRSAPQDDTDLPPWLLVQPLPSGNAVSSPSKSRARRQETDIMATRRRRTRKTTFRQLRADERHSDWYVELPDDRPTKRHPRVSEQEWQGIVNDLIVRNPKGDSVHTLWGDIPVGSPEWKKHLAGIAMGMGRRFFWEPLHSIGLTEEGARSYGGLLVSDSVRAAKRAKPRVTEVAVQVPVVGLW